MVVSKGGGSGDVILNIILAVVVMGVLGVYFLREYKNWSSKEEGGRWPLNISSCPDYWYLNEHGLCETKDTNSKYSLTNFNDCKIKAEERDKTKYISADFSKKSTSEKCIWAKKCKIAWDGIRNQC